jgi:hypothetical protein
MNLVLVCAATNDLCGVLQNRIPFQRASSLEAAVEAAPAGAGILLLADTYPASPTAVDPAILARARLKAQRVYVEFPSALPGMTVGGLHRATWERTVVTSGVFPGLEKLSILMIHGCHVVATECAHSHLVLGRVAGFGRALYGLPAKTWPLLFEHPERELLVATTKLSQFRTARYAPTGAWPAIWRWIIAWVTRTDTASLDLAWSPTVHPSFARNDVLPPDTEIQAVRRGIQWFRNARLFIHPAWEAEANRRLVDFPDGTGIGPDPAWPVGDGSCGMIEGANSKIHPDGTQDWRYFLRNDCMGEAAMAMAFGARIQGDQPGLTVARNLNDFIHFRSSISRSVRGDPDYPAYGLVTWNNLDGEGVYYGDDNARSLLGTVATAALLNETRWDESLLRSLFANLRTTGPQGFRSDRLEEADLREKGWRHYWTTARTNYAPHYEAWLWACFLWAYRHTGFAPFLERARLGIRLTMAAYPGEWRWTNGMQQERARMLLPLAWLVRVDDTPLHRSWLRTMAEELLQFQDASGAIREELGPPDRGAFGAPKTNEAYGTNEAPLIQENGDPLCDLLYTTNFAFVGLHEAAATTGESLYQAAEDRLAAFLCRIQVTAPTHPELAGAWFRAFDFQRWDYWASNADAGWGAWSIESGWTQSWITSTLALRHLKTSLWELTAHSRINRHRDVLVARMLPDAGPGPSGA